MDRNIDLTLKRDFYKGETSLERLIQNSINKSLRISTRLPWWELKFKRINSQKDIENYNYKNIITTGNKNERYNIELKKSVNNNRICERCGKPLRKYPWAIYYELCKECSAEMSGNFRVRICWRLMWNYKSEKRICWK